MITEQRSRMATGAPLHPALDRLPHHFFAAAQTHDAESHGRCFTGWRGSYEHVGRQAFHGEVTELWLWPLQIIHERIDQPCVWRGAAWDGAMLFLSIAASQVNLSVDGRALTQSALTVLPSNFISDTVSDAFNNAPLDTIAIAIHESALAQYARDVMGVVIPPELLSQTLSITDATALETFQGCVTSILQELTARPDLLGEESFRSQLKDRVMAMLVQVLDANIRAAQRLSPPSTRSYVVGKAVRYMDARMADSLEMVDLCQALRVCPRTLRYSFEEVVGVSPTQFLLATRLGRVRRALMQSNAASNVQCVAARFGFSHMGRFARFYQDAFGERPSATLKRKRAERSAADRSSNRSAVQRRPTGDSPHAHPSALPGQFR